MFPPSPRYTRLLVSPIFPAPEILAITKPMKMKQIIDAYRNAQSPAAQLSARLNRPFAVRRAKQYAAARDLIRSNDRKTEREAEENREFDRCENVRHQIGKNAEELKNLRHEIRNLCGELKRLCHSALATLYPSAAKACRQSLETLLQNRRDLMAANNELSASI